MTCTTLALGNSSQLIINLNVKLQYNINKAAAKISGLFSDEIDKYGYLTGEKTLPSERIRIKEHAKFNIRTFPKRDKK